MSTTKQGNKNYIQNSIITINIFRYRGLAEAMIHLYRFFCGADSGGNKQNTIFRFCRARPTFSSTGCLQIKQLLNSKNGCHERIVVQSLGPVSEAKVFLITQLECCLVVSVGDNRGYISRLGKQPLQPAPLDLE
jgi:hypothetical protein